MDAPRQQLITLAPSAYADPAIWQSEVERVLRPGWTPVARVDQLAAPGDYVAFELFGDPLVAVRGDDGELRVLSRVCRHRWMPVVGDGAGRRRSFQCPYHRWTYGLDGRLLGAPDMEATPGFTRAGCRLPSLRTEVWLGWLFVTFDANAAPLAPRLANLERAVASYRPERMRTLEPLVLEHEWNWKVMVENFIESYHHQGTHAHSLQPIVPASGTWAEDDDGPFVVLHNPTSGGDPLPPLLPETPGLTDAQRCEFVVGAAFPLLLFSIQADGMFWYRLEPVSARRIRLWIHPCVVPEALDDPAHAEGIAAMRALVAAVHAEDVVACAAVQRGVRASLAGQGALSHLELGIARFAGWWRSRMADGGDAASRNA